MVNTAQAAGAASIRDVGRRAIRLNLARVAFERFCVRGFSVVTFDELATAAGVSRSTFLRYFKTKEDALLFVFDIVGDETATALAHARDDEIGDMVREAVSSAASQLDAETPELRVVMELVRDTPELRAALLAKQEGWLDAAVPVLSTRVPGADRVLVEAELACGFSRLLTALHAWSSDQNNEALQSFLHRAFPALT